MLESNSDVRPLRTLVGRRLMSAKKLEIAQKSLNQMLLTLWRGGFVRLAPNPASYGIPMTPEATAALNEHRREQREKERRSRPFAEGLFDDSSLYDETNDESYDPAVYEKTKAKLDEPTPSPQSQLPPEFQIPEGFDFYGGEDLFNFDSLLTPRSEESEENSEPDVTRDAPPVSAAETTESPAETVKEAKKNEKPKLDIGSLSDDLRERLADSYRAVRAYPTPKIKTITSLRGVNPIYGTFLLEQLGIADRNERIQAFESLLEMPTSVARHVRPPRYEELPAGALANARLDKDEVDFADVIGPDEYHERVTNNAFTNHMVLHCLSCALRLKEIFADRPGWFSSLLKEAGYEKDWPLLGALLGRVRRPRVRDGVIEQFDGYFALEDCSPETVRSRLRDPREYWGGDHGVAGVTQVIKQADVIAMTALFPEDFSDREVEDNWAYYEPRTEHGSSLSACMYALTACRIGRMEDAWRLFLKTASIDVTGGGKQWAGEIYIGGTHPASNGGAWMIAALGFGGLRVRGGKAELRPRLPRQISRLTFPFTAGGKRMIAEITKEGGSIREA